MTEIETNFLHVSLPVTDLDLFFTGWEPEHTKFQWFTSETLAHLVHRAGLFPSVSQARKNGWAKPIPPGYSEYRGLGKQKISIFVLNAFPGHDWGDWHKNGYGQVVNNYEPMRRTTHCFTGRWVATRDRHEEVFATMEEAIKWMNFATIEEAMAWKAMRDKLLRAKNETETRS